MRRYAFAVTLVLCSLAARAEAAQPAAKAGIPRRPNIVWITCEDMGPHLGCYGDKFAVSPNIDRLAKRSLRYTHAWSNAPVCAPARTTIISGMYPPSTGSEHMRSMVKLPSAMHMFPHLLRPFGYYCTNRVKEDYNLVKTGKVWDDSSNKAHYKNRKPGQPFFAVFNFTTTHESQIRTRPHKLVLDPSKVPIPPYHPDTPEVRHDWTQYYDNIKVMDEQVGAILRELEEAGLADNTIVFFFSDHGSGMPRNKRFPYNSGLHVPLLVHVPDGLRHLAPKDYVAGGATSRLVSFVDLAPTVLSVAGEQAPDYHQGSAFLGLHAGRPNEHLFGFRGRMDERLDLIRSVRDERYVYVRNFMPHKAQGQYLDYMFQTPTTRVWKKLFDEKKLNAAQSFFWQPRPAEELYDLQNDPHETQNLAGSPEHRVIVEKMRGVLLNHLAQTRDLGLLTEDEMHLRAKGSTPYEMGRDDKKYPAAKVLAGADLASRFDRDQPLKSVELATAALENPDAAVRYWGAMGLLFRGKEAVHGAKGLAKALDDASPSVRIAAAEALGTHGDAAEKKRATETLVSLCSQEKHGLLATLHALNVLEVVGVRPEHWDRIKNAGKGDTSLDKRYQGYIGRVLEKIKSDLDAK